MSIIRMQFMCIFICLAVTIMSQRPAFSAEMGSQTHSHHMHDMSMPMAADIIADIKTDPAALTAGKPASILVSVRDYSGKPLHLTPTHDRIMHVVIVSADFSLFTHIHPEDFGPVAPAEEGKVPFVVHYDFPKAGKYVIGVDYAVNGVAYSKHSVVNVSGGAEMGRHSKDLSHKKRFGDYSVSLTTAPADPVSGKETILTYRFERNGVPVTDLSPYISAIMHVAVISEDLRHFIHEHGSLPGMPLMEMTGGHMMHEMQLPAKFGPEIKVPVTFPAAGLYVIFGQVQHEGKVILTKFMVEVK